jgi:hypothetical protein
MSKSLKLQVIETAKSLIQDERNWCRSVLARNADGRSVEATDTTAVRRCALGALVSAAYQLTRDHQQAFGLAIAALRPMCGSATLVRVNDMRGHAAVLALFDEARRRCE